MKNMNKKRVLIISIIIAIILVIIIAFCIINNIKNNNKYVSKNEIKTAADDTISLQKKVDEEIKEYLEDKKYTIDNPKILLNPYYISPLSALIIFNTNDNISYEVYVNDVKLTTMESSNKHAIPIYGLRAGEDNTIKLKSNNNIKEYKIKTENDKYKLNVDIKNNNNNEFYFLSGPMGLGNAAFDGLGNIVWYAAVKSAQDIEFLANGHILISTGENINGSQSGFYEIDYLGKIYNKYVLENSYHQEVNELYNGNLLVLGNNGNYINGYISIIDRKSAKEIKSLDLYEVFNKVDPLFADSLKNTEMNNNSAYYNEQNDELILSVRNLNSIISINFGQKTINWIIGNKDDFSSSFKNYFLTPSDDSRLPLGGHTAFINKDGYLGYFNNDYDPTVEYEYLNAYKESYSSAVYYELDLNNKKYKTVYEYIPDTKEWNYAMGSFNETYDNHKLINFGWSFPKKYFDDVNMTIYDEIGITYSRIIELDENNNVIFNATLDESTYRAFKNKLYKEETNNYEVVDYKLIDSTPYTKLEEIDTNSIEDKLDNAKVSPYELNLTKNSIDLNAVFDDLEDVKIVLVKDNGKSYILNYKPIDVEPLEKVNINLSGKYAIYISINNTYYNQQTSVDFE